MIYMLKEMDMQGKELDNEIWKTIENFSRYQVSNLGRVKCVLRRNNAYHNYYSANYIMKDFYFQGYKRIQLTNDDGEKVTINVHRLVAMAFIPKIDGKPFVNHKDGNKSNNKVENLEWCTNQENIIHAINTGLRKTKLGKVRPKKEKLSKEALHKLQVDALDKYRNKAVEKSKQMFSKKINQYDLNGNFIKQWIGLRNIERQTGIHRSNITNVCKHKQKTARGYIWRFADE